MLSGLGILALFMVVMTKLYPLTEPKVMPVSNINVSPHPRQYAMGGAVIAMTVFLYIVFW